MKLTSALLDRLNLVDAAKLVTVTNLDRFPQFVTEKALAGSGDKLASQVVADFSSGERVSTSTMSMPRKGFGPRPVTVLSARDRVLYDALVAELRKTLPPPSRGPENWESFRAFGLPAGAGAPKYIVTLDIASMYEYVDHAVLKRELLMQTLDGSLVQALIDLLSESFPFSRGIPQMMNSSDLLGDVYLDILERELLRQGYELVRYADDFRVLATTWGEAHQIIEHAAEAARDIGLVLSSEKTTVRLASKFADDERGLEELFDKYFKEAKADLTAFDDVMDWYGEPSQIELEPEKAEAMREAFRRVLSDWFEPSTRKSIPPQLVSKAVNSLASADKRINDDILQEIALVEPIKLSNVISYLGARVSEAEENLASLVQLTTMERQSPWAKIWMLNAADASHIDESAAAIELKNWVARQLENEHEVVRAEAAWVMTRWGGLSEEALSDLFGRATRITRPGLAAALGRSGLPEASSLARSIVRSSPIFKEAYEWGKLGATPTA